MEESTLVPPYWQAHQRTDSSGSVDNSPAHPPPITLEDHTEHSCEQSSALWAKSVTIQDYAIIRGSRTGVGAYVVWNCSIETLDGGPMMIRKRYSEFDELRRKLLETFPTSEAALPPLPPKSVISRFQPKFLQARREGLSYFLNCVLLNPEFAGSPVLKEFVFS
ncbi:PX-domain-containing protein [Xylona heveae TC161]|uniref:Endosomal/vacuolar adapter protein YPT35 n=1 Tax=Xylona heveae (strain CBS 132557 / TC161) TaxID=1328760 RepID=A0A165JEL1_XYLHT|nr:PX-domain-containing protein [Xylona heveae TC161]KZF26137.1 PX-domain-containing protein [Xylona heveae TC161]